MTTLLLIASLFFAPDSLPPACHCEVPDFFKPKKVNKDTLRYFKKKGQYKRGLRQTLHYLNTDSTDIELIGWMGDLGYHLAEKLTRNQEIRSKKYGKNPHINAGYIQDSTRYIVYHARKNFGPNLWNETLRRQVGGFVLCSTHCATELYPQRRNYFEKYIEVLIAMGKFDKVRDIVKSRDIPLQGMMNQKFRRHFFVRLSEFYIGYGTYKEGVKFVRSVLNSYSINNATQALLGDIFHYAVKSDERIPRNRKPLIHEKIIQNIPDPR